MEQVRKAWRRGGKEGDGMKKLYGHRAGMLCQCPFFLVIVSNVLLEQILCLSLR